MLKVAVVGASGYTGVELLRILIGHPEVEICVVTSRQHEGVPIDQVFPSLQGFCGLVCEPLNVALIAKRVDLVFTALPHKSAMEVVPAFLQAGCRVVDLSADYRLKDQSVYEHWYQTHSSPELLKKAVYGLPELYRQQLSGARLVANPGCYPTSVILGLTPLLKNKLINAERLIIDSKSGTSGAGRGVKQGSLFCEVNEGFKAYGVANHRHMPEIEQELS
ncbi:MAG: N-acetyl-gamma-glutamyl-phosphate reductase, partial [Deltaproteobacteria bacterium]|nr:N-acetyl-gamma-glutamyl-phosphate reductase [Deltaproteobacteria bacterium]